MFNQMLRKKKEIPKRDLTREIKRLAMEFKIAVEMIEKMIRENKVKKLEDASLGPEEIPITLEELISEMKE